MITLETQLNQDVSPEVWNLICDQIDLDRTKSPSVELLQVKAGNWQKLNKNVLAKIEEILSGANDESTILEVVKIRVLIEAGIAYSIHQSICRDINKANDFRSSMDQINKTMREFVYANESFSEDLAEKLWDLDGEFHKSLFQFAKKSHLGLVVELVLRHLKQYGLAKKLQHCIETNSEHENIIEAILNQQSQDPLHDIVAEILTHVKNASRRWDLKPIKEKITSVGLISPWKEPAMPTDELYHPPFINEVAYVRLRREIECRNISKEDALRWIVVPVDESYYVGKFPGDNPGYDCALDYIRRLRLSENEFIIVFYDPQDPFFSLD